MPQTQNGLEQDLKLTNPSEFSVSVSSMMLRQAKLQLHRITQLNLHFLQSTLGQFQNSARTVGNQIRTPKCNGNPNVNPFLAKIPTAK